MTAPFAEVLEKDMSQRIPAGNGIYGALQIPAPIGTTDRTLIGSDTALLNNYTVNNTVEVGYDQSFYSALAYLKKSNKLWVKRVVSSSALFGGIVVTVGTTVASRSLNAGLADPSAYTFDSTGSGAVAEQISVVCKDDFNGSLGGKYFILPGQAEFIYLKCQARAEQATITCLDDINGNLNNKFLILMGQTHYCWFNVNSAGTDPGETNTSLTGMTGIEIALSTNATATQVATALVTAVGDSGFTGSSSAAVATITKSTAGLTTRGNAGNCGFTYVTSVFGLNATADVTVEGMTGLAASYAGGSNAAAIATSVLAAAQTSANFTSSKTDATVTITCGTTGPKANALDGPDAKATGFAITTIRQGSSKSGSECLLIYFQNQGEAAKNYLVKIFNYEDYPSRVKINSAFIVEVYKKSNLNAYVESFTCSRDENAVDANNRNIYVEKVLEASQYIRAIDNVEIDSAEMPQSIPNGLYVTGGSDGASITTSDMILASQDLKSKDKVEVSLLMDGGWSATAYKSSLDEIASSRGDAVAITSIPYYLESASSYLNSIINYRKYEYNVNSSYSAVYTPHINIYDYFNDRYIDVPPDGYVAGAISDADKNYKIWYPVLGFKRGTLTNVQDVHVRYTTTDMDELYANQINPIRFIPGKGIVIWGQKTMQAQASALDRLNVRLLLVAMKPKLQEFLENYIGELNTETNRNNLKSTVDNYMDNIKANDGVYSFKCICDDSNNTSYVIDNNQLKVDLYIAPTRAIEYITMTIILTSSDVTFE